MTLVYWIAGVIALGVVDLFVCRLTQTGEIRMNIYGWLQIIFYFAVLVLCVKPLGLFMAKVYQGERTFLTPVFAPLERFIYRLAGVHPEEEMDWKVYAVAVLLFSVVGFVFLYLLQRIQGFLPLNPAGMGAVSPDSSLNTAVSFVTNTNWQGYGGETTMSYLTQMLGLTVQNFVSAATGMAILVAFIRGLTRHNTRDLGNFWVDLTRSTLYILLPLSIVLALVLVSQGVVQTFAPYATANLVQPVCRGRRSNDYHANDRRWSGCFADCDQTAGHQRRRVLQRQLGPPLGKPHAIVEFPGNVVDPAHPGRAVLHLWQDGGRYPPGLGDPGRHDDLAGRVSSELPYAAEAERQPALGDAGGRSDRQRPPARRQHGRAKKCALASPIRRLWATATTAASNGSVNSMHDSFTPLGGLVPLVMMMFGEVVFGGVGSGLYGMLVFVIVAVFVAGLMVGRTPEYLGKKIEAYEMKMASLLILIMPLTVLGLTAVAVSVSAGQSSVLNPGPHGFSEILYAFTSQGNNNGSAFAGLSANTVFYNLTGALAMLISRFWLAVPTLALAGSLAPKEKGPGRARARCRPHRRSLSAG